jgi:hypothetical protein
MKTYRLTFDFKNGKQIEIDITCDEEIIDDISQTITEMIKFKRYGPVRITSDYGNRRHIIDMNEIQHFSWYVKLDNGNK